MRPFHSSATLLLLSGCASLNAPAPLTADAVDKAQFELKRQVGIYMELAAADDARRGSDLWDAGRTPDTRKKWQDRFSCGIGNTSYQIDGATVEMITSVEMNAGISAKTVVFPSASIGSDATNSQDLTYVLKAAASQPNITPLIVSDEQRQALLKGDKTHAAAPIAAVLLAMRDGMVQAALKPPQARDEFSPVACFADETDGTDKNTHSIKIGANTVVSGSLAVITLASVSLGPSLTVKDTSNTTITVTFSYHPLVTNAEMDEKKKPARLILPGQTQATLHVRQPESRALLTLASYQVAQATPPQARPAAPPAATPSPAGAPPKKDPCAGLGEAGSWSCGFGPTTLVPDRASPVDKAPVNSKTEPQQVAPD